MGRIRSRRGAGFRGHESMRVWNARPFVRAAIVFLSMCLGLAAAHAAEPPAPPAGAPARPALDPADIEAFLDGLVPLQIEANDIAGATIAIVKDGKVLFAKGYGFADMETRTPVTPETMFRVGSITKVFTWTAVMQLVEQGKIDLDADINTYLDFKIDGKGGKPITMRHLMTHRAGFQEAIKNLGAQNSGKADLAGYIRNNTPDRIFEPGTVPSYSNYGAALAGYIVERVSGMPCDTYFEEKIYAPLGMMRTSIRQPLQKELEPYMSKGYNLASGDVVPFEIVSGYPAGSQASSALDMTKFMIAHLSAGKLGDAQILTPASIVQMHDTVAKVDERQNGMALGFYETSRNGLRIISHGGDTIAFHSDMHLIQSEGLGFFVSYNSTGRGDTSPRSSVWRKFLDRYYPHTPPAKPAEVSGLGVNDVVGSYVTSRRIETSLLKAFSELSQATVSVNDDGTLSVSALTGVNGQPRRFEQVGDGLFREVNGQDQLVFKKEADGSITLAPWSAGVIIFHRVEPSRSAMTQLLIAGTASAIVFLNLLLWPVAAFVRWRYYTGLEWRLPAHLLRLGTMAASAALLTMIYGIALLFLPLLNDPWKIDDTLDPTMRMLQMIGMAGAALTVVPVANAVQSWWNPLRGLLGRVKETAVAMSCLALVWFAWSMNLFDLSQRY